MDTDEGMKRALLQSRQMEFIGMTQINSVARLRQLVRSYYRLLTPAPTKNTNSKAERMDSSNSADDHQNH